MRVEVSVLAIALAMIATTAHAKVLAKGALVEKVYGNCQRPDTITPDEIPACSSVFPGPVGRRSGTVLDTSNGEYVPTGCELGDGRGRWSISVTRAQDGTPDLVADARVSQLAPACDGLEMALVVDLSGVTTTACEYVDRDLGVCSDGHADAGWPGDVPPTPGSRCTVVDGACTFKMKLPGAYAGEVTTISTVSIGVQFLSAYQWWPGLASGLAIR